LDLILLTVFFLVLQVASQTEKAPAQTPPAQTSPAQTTPAKDVRAANPAASSSPSSTGSVSEPVNFVQITDAHLFDGGKRRATQELAQQEQQDNWKAFHWAVEETNRLSASGARIDFVVFTGDFGLEFVRRSSEKLCLLPRPKPSNPTSTDASNDQGNTPSTDQPPPDELDAVKKKGWITLFPFEHAAAKVAGEFSHLHVPVVYIVPGNNDVVGEDPCDLQRYKDFVGLVGQAMKGHAPRIVDLSADQPVPEYHGFGLLGLNSASFKDPANYGQTCAKPDTAGCPSREMARLQDIVLRKSSPLLYLIFTHVPYLNDPYSRKKSWNDFPVDDLSAWQKIATSSTVAAIFAGHFHDSRRSLYATLSDATGLSIEGGEAIAQKIWVAPPLAMKNQESASPSARGFLLVHVQRTGGTDASSASISVIPFWFPDRAHRPWYLHPCLHVAAHALLVLGILLLLGILFVFYRSHPQPPSPSASQSPPEAVSARAFWIAIYPAVLTITLLVVMEILVRVVMEFMRDRLNIDEFYTLIPLFGAVGGAVGSVLRGDTTGENKIILASIENPSRIRAGIVGDIAIGIGGAATVVVLFERALAMDTTAINSSAKAFLIGISFIAGVFGKNVIEIARRKFDKELDEKLKEKSEEARRATQEASALKEKARLATNDNKPAEALKILNAALEKNPNYINNYIEKGRALKRLGKVEEALAVLREALKISPEYPKVLYNMACYKAVLKRDKAEVLADLEKAIEGDPSLRDYAKTDSDFNDLATDPDFRKLVWGTT
jgi:hypothetical protein